MHKKFRLIEIKANFISHLNPIKCDFVRFGLDAFRMCRVGYSWGENRNTAKWIMSGQELMFKLGSEPEIDVCGCFGVVQLLFSALLRPSSQSNAII